MILKAKEIARQRRQKTKQAVQQLARPPHLAFVLVGQDPAARSYIRSKDACCQEVGITTQLQQLPRQTAEDQLLQRIAALNSDPRVDAILVQLPLPPQIAAQRVIAHIDPSKDVDGFHPLNIGKLLLEDPSALIPCTPLGIIALLEAAAIPLRGRHVVILGRSQIVGRPLAALLLQRRISATVTILHRHSRNSESICQQADILVVAIGQPEAIGPSQIGPGAVVIDVGIHHQQQPDGRSKIVGDVAFAAALPRCAAITPVPGGIGLMTTTMLLENTLRCYLLQPSR